MKTTNRTSFWLENFSIKEFSFTEPKNPEKVSIEMNFEVNGIYNEITREFELLLNFIAIDKLSSSASPFIKVIMRGKFVFYTETKLPVKDIPDIFYSNSIGIIFPYLRSFISTLTLQAGIKLFILPILNVSGLGGELKGNTKVSNRSKSKVK